MIVGVKVLVGVSGHRYLPSSVRLGSGEAACVVAPQPPPTSSPRRWIQLLMPAADALACHPDAAVLYLGPPQDAGAHIRLHHLQVRMRAACGLMWFVGLGSVWLVCRLRPDSNFLGACSMDHETLRA